MPTVSYFRGRYGVGRRGAFLALMGLIYVAIGLGIMTVPPSEVQRTALDLLTQITSSYAALGVLWLGCGLAAAALGFGGPRADSWGYRSLMLPPALWAACYAVSGVLDQRPVFALAVLIYGALALCVGVIAGWPEPV